MPDDGCRGVTNPDGPDRRIDSDRGLQQQEPPQPSNPLQVQAILEKGLALRDRYRKRKISRHGYWTATGRLEAELDRLLARSYRDSANRRLAKQLARERPYLFTFLYCPGLDATNNAAERALRPLVVARQNWGGTEPGKKLVRKPCSAASWPARAGRERTSWMC